MIIEILSFVISCILLSWLSGHLVKSLTKIAKYFGIKEFIIAFFVLGFAASLPNLFVDVSAAVRGFPQISIGDMIGGNLVDLTLVMALAIFFSKKNISADSRMVQGSAVFTSVVAILPLLLLLKDKVTRVDGFIMIGVFFIYAFWLFSKDDRFKKEYAVKQKITRNEIVWMVLKTILILVILFFASQQIINSANYFAGQLGASLSLVAILIVGLGNCFPETYFSIISARKNHNWMILGDLMASVIVCATLVFGIVAVIHPFTITDVSQIFIARIFLIIASVFFLICIKNDKKLSKKEGMLLLFIYIVFLITEIFIKF
jgi:cation:H+ antiporter